MPETMSEWLIAVPAWIVVAGLLVLICRRRQYELRRANPNRCPSCGQRFNEWFVHSQHQCQAYCWPCWNDKRELHLRGW